MATKTDELISKARQGDTDARAYLVMEAGMGNHEARAYLATEGENPLPAPETIPEPRTEAEATEVPVDRREVWKQLVRADEYLKLEALVTATSLADFADESMEVRVSQRSLTDAVDRPDSDGRRSKFVRTGLKYLIDRGWVQHLNAGAARQERRHLRLAVPMSQWPF